MIRIERHRLRIQRLDLHCRGAARGVPGDGGGRAGERNQDFLRGVIPSERSESRDPHRMREGDPRLAFGSLGMTRLLASLGMTRLLGSLGMTPLRASLGMTRLL